MWSSSDVPVFPECRDCRYIPTCPAIWKSLVWQDKRDCVHTATEKLWSIASLRVLLSCHLFWADLWDSARLDWEPVSMSSRKRPLVTARCSWRCCFLFTLDCLLSVAKQCLSRVRADWRSELMGKYPSFSPSDRICGDSLYTVSERSLMGRIQYAHSSACLLIHLHFRPHLLS